MITFKSVGFSYVNMSSHVCQAAYLCVFKTTFSPFLAHKFQEIQMSLIYQKLRWHLKIGSLHISSQFSV